MTDDLHNRGPADRARVNVNEPWELTYWSKKFACTTTRLHQAVKAVGVMANDVEAWLKKNA